MGCTLDGRQDTGNPATTGAGLGPQASARPAEALRCSSTDGGSPAPAGPFPGGSSTSCEGPASGCPTFGPGSFQVPSSLPLPSGCALAPLPCFREPKRCRIKPDVSHSPVWRGWFSKIRLVTSPSVQQRTPPRGGCPDHDTHSFTSSGSVPLAPGSTPSPRPCVHNCGTRLTSTCFHVCPTMVVAAMLVGFQTWRPSPALSVGPAPGAAGPGGCPGGAKMLYSIFARY